MQYMAKWGQKGFLLSPTTVVPFNDFSTSLSVKEESKDDANGNARINVRGRELRPISFSTTYHRSLGVDPYAQWKSWEAELGKSYPLYIGGKQIGTNQMMLTGVSTAEVMLTPSGEWLSCKVSLTLKEHADGKETVLLTNGNSTNANAGNSKNNSNANKKAAIEATPPKAVKEQKKPTPTHSEMVAAAGKRRVSNARPR